MGVMQGFRNLFVGSNDDEDYEDEYVQDDNQETSEEEPTERRGRDMRIQSSSSSVQIVLARPNDFSEVKSIGDDLNAQKTVLLNLETVKSDDAKRILDFLSGVAYANGADIKMMAQKTFAIMPKNVGFSGVDLMSELDNSGYDLNEF